MLSVWLYICGACLVYELVERHEKDNGKRPSRFDMATFAAYWPLLLTAGLFVKLLKRTPPSEVPSRAMALARLRKLRGQLLREEVTDQRACGYLVLDPAIAALEVETECAECGAAVQPCVRDCAASDVA